MDRLTKYMQSGVADISDTKYREKARCDAVQRLAAYEDTGLTPEQIAETKTAQPLEDWVEDDGFVLWWKFPVDEPPYCGSPLCSDWPGYHTHWTPLICPDEPIAPYTRDRSGQIHYCASQAVP